MLRISRLFGTAALGLVLGLAGCEEDVLMRPFGTVPVDPLFERYVSVGNSITAGFQSGGITDSVQQRSYAVLIARQMRTALYIPSMQDPGCPSLFTNVFTTPPTRVPGPVCALRKRDSYPSPYINNVAVPGAEVMDAIDNLNAESNANALTTFFLGGLTQMEMLQRVRPTFVTVWIGNNDVLGAATNAADAGNPALVTPPATFATRYDQMLGEIDDIGPTGGVLIGVANVTAIPYFSLGSTYWAIDNGLVPGQAFPPAFVVGPQCAPAVAGGQGDQTLVPFPFGGALLAQAAAGMAATLTCTEPQTVQPAELANLIAAVTAYNQTVSAAAAARGWAYFNPNPTLDSLRAIPTEVAPFPSFGAPCALNPFGLAFTCDGVHPSSRTHRLVANKLIQAINTTYGTSLAAVP
jgi:lysophospholipase L1-like esterase